MIRILIGFILCVSLATAQTFVSGDKVKVSVSAVDCLNARTAPTILSTILKCQTVGTAGTIVSGPTIADGYHFYYLTYSDGIKAYSAGEFLELVTPAPPPPPVDPPPSGTLLVTKLPGPVTISFTSINDTALVLMGLPKGLSSGTVTFPLAVDATFGMTLYGRGGVATYSASTVNGTPLPTPVDLKHMLDSAYAVGVNVGKTLVGVDSVDVWLSNGRRITR